MIGYLRLKWQRLGPLLLASIVTSIATVTEAQEYCGPRIITYGEPCPLEHRQNLPYQIQTPLTIPKPPESVYSGKPGGKCYGYNIVAPPSQWPSSNVHLELPVSVQMPVVRNQYSGFEVQSDHLRGRTYGVGIENVPIAPRHSPSLGSFDFKVQKSVPGPKNQQATSDSSRRLNVLIQPVGDPHYGTSLWEPLFVGIERPAPEPSDREGTAGAPPKLLTGLCSKIDRILIPACDRPVIDRHGNGGNSVSSSCGCSG